MLVKMIRLTKESLRICFHIDYFRFNLYRFLTIGEAFPVTHQLILMKVKPLFSFSRKYSHYSSNDNDKEQKLI